MRVFIAFLIIAHGCIHLMGFAKAYQLAELKELAGPISKNVGIIWLIIAVVFVISAILYLSRNEEWIWFAIVAAILSQIVVFNAWSDARYGTIMNVLILAIASLSFANWTFMQTYHRDIQELLTLNHSPGDRLIRSADLEHLPMPVQKYLDYVGVVGTPLVHNFKVKMSGKMRRKGDDWFSIKTEQLNSIDHPARLFFMTARIKNLPTSGYHAFNLGKASMSIKLFSLFTVSEASGPMMDQSETVTFLNDLCLMAPAALINPNIQWEEVDSLSARAQLTIHGKTISALLQFNENGQLTNFVSDDRYDINDQRKYRFSTPVREYGEFDGFRLCSVGEAVWEYPDGNFTYGQFFIDSIEYNITPGKE